MQEIVADFSTKKSRSTNTVRGGVELRRELQTEMTNNDDICLPLRKIFLLFLMTVGFGFHYHVHQPGTNKLGHWKAVICG
jgi:hypothetical protein